MKSCVYSGTVFHKRFLPREHQFSYDMDYLFINLSEFEALCSISPLWSVDRPNLISLRRSDYLPSGESLFSELRNRIKQLGGDDFSGDAYLLTTPRRLGHCMNPISVFYCYDDGAVKYVLTEVHNTPWGERFCYLLEGPEFSGPTDKAFHVSPFMPMDTTYQWQLGDPTDTLHVAINVSRNWQPLFTAAMHLKRVELSKDTIMTLTARQIRQSFKTMAGIYFQALRLWLKKVPFFPHPKIKLQESNP